MFGANSFECKVSLTKALLTIFAIALLVGLPTRPAMAQSPIANGSFETADYTGWTLFEGPPGATQANCGVWGIGQNGQIINQGDTTFDFF